MIISLILIFGLTLISSVNSGLKNFYKTNITGDYVIMAESGEPISIFGALNPVIDEFINIPVLDYVDEIEGILTNHFNITKQITGSAVLKVGSSNYPTPFFGIDENNFFNFFPSITILEGRNISGRGEILLNTDQKELYKSELGDKLLMTIFSDGGFKIREVTLVGYYSYTEGADHLSSIVLVDQYTARELTSIFQVDEEVAVTDNEVDLLLDDFDSLFSSDETTTDDNSEEIDLLDSLFDSDEPEITPEKVEGAWNFILLNSNNRHTKSEIKNLLKDYSVKVLDWLDAAGQAAYIGSLMFYFFLGGFILVSIGAGIGIVNVVTISVINRTSEIGTIRSLGAHKTTVLFMIISELLLLGLTGITLGLFSGISLLKLINHLSITLPGNLLKSIFGSSILNIGINYSLIPLVTLLILLFVLLSSIYPLKKAMDIKPLEAINRV